MNIDLKRKKEKRNTVIRCIVADTHQSRGGYNRIVRLNAVVAALVNGIDPDNVSTVFVITSFNGQGGQGAPAG